MHSSFFISRPQEIDALIDELELKKTSENKFKNLEKILSTRHHNTPLLQA